MKVVKALYLLLVICVTAGSVFAQETLIGVIEDTMYEVNPNTAEINPLIQISNFPDIEIHDLTYSSADCAYFGFIGVPTDAQLVKVSRDGVYELIGDITVPNETVGLVESITVHEDVIYAGVSLNGDSSTGDFYSETLVSLDPETAIGTIIFELDSQDSEMDLDLITFHNGYLYFLNPQPPSENFTMLKRATFGSISSVSDFELLWEGFFISFRSFAFLDDETIVTPDIDGTLYSIDFANDVLSVIGNTHTLTETNVYEMTSLAYGAAPIVCSDDGDCLNGLEYFDENTCDCLSEASLVGCTDPAANNYNPDANCDTGECNYDSALSLDVVYECSGLGDGVVNILIIATGGETDPNGPDYTLSGLINQEIEEGEGLQIVQTFSDGETFGISLIDAGGAVETFTSDPIQCVKLAIALTDFFGTALHQSNLLEWQTESELDNEYFELQRSVQGQEWHIIAVLDGAGTSIERNEYSIHDSEIDFAESYYYRIRAIDFNGLESFSWVVQVKRSPELSEYLQVIGDELIISGQVEWFIFNANGVMIRRESGLVPDYHERISLKQLPSGIYFISLVKGGIIHTVPIWQSR